MLLGWVNHKKTVPGGFGLRKYCLCLFLGFNSIFYLAHHSAIFVRKCCWYLAVNWTARFWPITQYQQIRIWLRLVEFVFLFIFLFPKCVTITLTRGFRDEKTRTREPVFFAVHLSRTSDPGYVTIRYLTISSLIRCCIAACFGGIWPVERSKDTILVRKLQITSIYWYIA